MRRVILAIVSTVTGLVLLLSFKAHATSTVTSPPAAVSTGGGKAGAAAGSSGSSTKTGSSGSSPKTGTSHASRQSTGSATRTVVGAAAGTIYGPVQVKITVRNGRLVSVAAVEYPEQDPHDAQINAYAIPALNREALQADSAHIDMISGATYTSTGYISSLQSALDKAGL